MMVTLITEKTVSEAAVALKSAVQADHCDGIKIRNITEAIAAKGVKCARGCVIIEVCRPQQAKKALDQDTSVSSALACRITIYEEGGTTTLSTLNPTALLAVLNALQLERTTKDVRNKTVRSAKETASR